MIGINSNQEKAEMTLVYLVTWPEGFKFIDHRLHVAQQHSLYELITQVPHHWLLRYNIMLNHQVQGAHPSGRLHHN